MKYLLLTGFLLACFQVNECNANARYADVVVAADGSGDFKTLTEAMNALPMYNYQRYVIYVKNGIYNERVLIDRDYITVLGESRDSTIIQFSLLRSDWQAKPDHIGAAVINITSDDVILENLTIQNTQPQTGPHAFAVYGTGTRIVILNCNVTSNGGDTVSLWNYKNGMYYHANCYFEGGVDFVCPRGWCYIRDSKFYENTNTAAIWHAAVTNRNQKMVLLNCTFNGVQDYYLARHHYEAQFYFLHCTFSSTMMDKPLFYYCYPDEPGKNRPYFYGDRHYFYDCHRTGGDYAWHADNVSNWPNHTKPEDIDAKWTFDGNWDPESTAAPDVVSYEIKDNRLFVYFNELLCIRGRLKMRTATGKDLIFNQGQGRDILSFTCNGSLDERDLQSPLTIISGQIVGNTATSTERALSTLNLQQ